MSYVRFSPYLLAVALSLVVFQTSTPLSCFSGDTSLSEFALIVDGEDQLVGFAPGERSYEARLAASTRTALVRAISTDPEARVWFDVLVDSERNRIAHGLVGGGEVVVPLEVGSSTIEVWVRAPHGASGVYSVDVSADGVVPLPGLRAEVTVTTDLRGIPHIVADTLADAFYMQGYVQARDRFWTIDYARRGADGRRAELRGIGLLVNDARQRLLSRRAIAQRSLSLLSGDELELLEAHAAGINAWVDRNPLPPIYTERGIDEVPPWEVIDTLMLYAARGGYTVSDQDEIEKTAVLAEYEAALGSASGRALFFDDVLRVAPMYPASVVPDAVGTAPKSVAKQGRSSATGTAALSAEARELVRQSAEKFRARPDADAQRRLYDGSHGSNTFGVSASYTSSGAPLIAGDGHGSVLAPSGLYDVHLTVRDDPTYGSLNASGFAGAGEPGLLLGQTENLSWTLTNGYPDVCDVFADRLLRDAPGCPARLCIESEGSLHPVDEHDEQFFAIDSSGELIDRTSLLEAAHPWSIHRLTVPFRNQGPILSVTDANVVRGPDAGEQETTVLTLQCPVFAGTRNPHGFIEMLTARTAEEFGAGVQQLTQMYNNYLVADRAGNLAYLHSGEVPLRADLESGVVHGELPYLVRDGSGPANWIPDPDRTQGQTMPYRIVPRDEMPAIDNPPAGFVVSANNTPLGYNLDNDLTNDLRPSNPTAIHYLGPHPAPSLRAGRLTKLISARLETDQPVTAEDMKRWQTTTECLAAELFMPSIAAAWENAQAPGAPAELAAFTADTALAEAVSRLAAWDFSHPTGIPEGYDSSDVDGVRNPVVSAEEAANSVAATLYANWRAQFINRTVGSALAGLGLTHKWPILRYKALLHLLEQEPFTGVGASGVDFFPGTAALTVEARRDVLVLESLRAGLASLQSDTYAPAFGGSSDQDDYRWGYLKRLRVIEGWSGAVVIPTAGGFENLSDALPGISREGGPLIVNVSGSSVIARGWNAFLTNFSPMYRVIHAPGDPSAGADGVLGWSSLAGGGNAEDPASPYFAAQFASYLTGDHHRVPMNEADVSALADKVETFRPAD